MGEKPFTPQQFQMLMEFISAQVICGVIEHECRVHQPNNPQAVAMLNKANEGRKEMLMLLRAHLVQSS